MRNIGLRQPQGSVEHSAYELFRRALGRGDVQPLKRRDRIPAHETRVPKEKK